jgi:hypothetical protein
MDFAHKERGDLLHAMEIALALEKLNFSKLRELHEVPKHLGWCAEGVKERTLPSVDARWTLQATKQGTFTTGSSELQPSVVWVLLNTRFEQLFVIFPRLWTHRWLRSTTIAR